MKKIILASLLADLCGTVQANIPAIYNMSEKAATVSFRDENNQILQDEYGQPLFFNVQPFQSRTVNDYNAFDLDKVVVRATDGSYRHVIRRDNLGDFSTGISVHGFELVPYYFIQRM